MGSRILKILTALLFSPLVALSQPQNEIDPRSIWLNGTKTTTASIPFALGAWIQTGSRLKFDYDDTGGSSGRNYKDVYINLDVDSFGLVINGGYDSAFGLANNLYVNGGSGATGTANLGGNAYVQGGTGGSAGANGGNAYLVGGTRTGSANYGWVQIGDSGTPNKFTLTSINTKRSLYVNKDLEVDGTTYLDGALNVVGTTTLATSLSGLANLASGVVSAITSTQGDIFYASAANTVSKLAKNTSATRYLSNTGSSNNPAWAQVDLSNGVTGVLPVTSTSLTVTSPITYTAGDIGFDFNTNNAWGDVNTFNRTVKIYGDSSDSSAIPLYIQAGAVSASDKYIKVVDETIKDIFYVDHSGNAWSQTNITAGAQVGGVTGYITGNSTTAFKVEYNGVNLNTLVVDTTNKAIGVNQAALTTSAFSILENTKNRAFDISSTISTRATGASQVNIAHTLNWSSGSGVSTGYNTFQVALTDSHVTSTAFNDVIRSINNAVTRSSSYTFPNALSSLAAYNISTYSDAGIYNRNSILGQTVNSAMFGYIPLTTYGTPTISPTYTDGSASGTLTYNAAVIQGGFTFAPVITNVGSLIIGNMRGVYINALTGSTGTGITSNLYGVDLGSMSTAATAIGFRAQSVSASTSAIGLHIPSVTTATTSYGVKIDTVSGVTTAIGLGVTAIPTTATNKYQVALDGTGTGSGIYFDTPTIAGTQYIRAASATALEVGAPTSVNIASGYLYLTSTSADPTNGFQMYFYKPNYDLSASGKYGGFGEWHVTTPGANGFYGLQFTAQTDHTSGTQSGGMSAVNANVNIFHTGTGADSGSHNAGNYQITNYSALNSSGTWTAILGRIANNAAGNINVARSFSALNYLSGAGNVTTSINYYAQGFSDGGAGALTNNYGIYVEELTAGSTINREIFIAGAGGTYFRDGNQKIYSSAASTLDVTANTTYQERIGGTVQTTLTSDLLTLKDSFNIAVNTGTGTKIGTSSAQKIGLWNATPVAQHSSTGETVGFTAGAGTNVTDASTFTGNVGATAYRISDIVKALKNAGIMAQ